MNMNLNTIDQQNNAITKLPNDYNLLSIMSGMAGYRYAFGYGISGNPLPNYFGAQEIHTNEENNKETLLKSDKLDDLD